MSEELLVLIGGNIIAFAALFAKIAYDNRTFQQKEAERRDEERENRQEALEIQQRRHEENLVAMTKISARLESLEHLHECVDSVRDEVRQIRDMFSTLNQRFTDHLELYRLRHDEISRRVDRVERKRKGQEDAD